MFFPGHDSTTQLLVATATIGVAFLARPVGGVLFGIYADHKGRKPAMSLIILIMTVGTGMVAVLPTYASIGIAAPVLLVLARLLQGASAGGEFSSATSMLVEFAPDGQRGYLGSFQMVSQSLAFALGAAVSFTLSSLLSKPELAAWGWRIPFAIGLIIGPVGHYIRVRVDESPEFAAYMAQRKQRTQVPLMDVLRNHPRGLMSSLGLVVVGSVSSYVVLIYTPLFAAAKLGIGPSGYIGAMLLGSLCVAVLAPVAGRLADRLGAKKVMTPAILLYAVAAFIGFIQLHGAPNLESLMRLEFTCGCLMAFFWGPTPSALADAFPVQLRSTGMALVYNLGVMLFGGLAPFFLTTLVHWGGLAMAPAIYIGASALLGVIACLLLAPPMTRAQARQVEQPG